MKDSERRFLFLKCIFFCISWSCQTFQMLRAKKLSSPIWFAEWTRMMQFWKELLEAHLKTPSWWKSKDFYTDLYLPVNYVHEKQNQNEIQIFTKINSCFVSFFHQPCQNRVLSITDNSSDVCVCWWISWEALLLAQTVKRSHLYFNGLRSSGRMWLHATISQWKRGSYVVGNLFVRVFYPYKWN